MPFLRITDGVSVPAGRIGSSTGQLIRVSSLGDAVTAAGNNFFAVKVSYWIGVR
jgi:hypothetical protein